MIKGSNEKHISEFSHAKIIIILLGLLLPARVYWRPMDRLPVD
jgi:hypothetical protein